jgi:hypothetical protein
VSINESHAKEIASVMNSVLRDEYEQLKSRVKDQLKDFKTSNGSMTWQIVAKLEEFIDDTFVKADDSGDWIYFFTGGNTGGRTETEYGYQIADFINQKVEKYVKLTYGSSDEFQIILTVKVEVDEDLDESSDELTTEAVKAIGYHERRAIAVLFDLNNPDEVELED